LFFFPEKLDLKRNSPYDAVESFVLFVGYPRSGHSLIGAILDSHPEIIIPHEFDLLNKLNRFFNDPNEESNSRRLRIFSKLHSVSRRQAMFGNRSPNYSHGYSYHIPGSWQGKYKNQIMVRVKFTFIVSSILQFQFNSLVDLRFSLFRVLIPPSSPPLKLNCKKNI